MSRGSLVIKKAIEAQNQAIAAAVARADFPAFAKLYAPDADILPPGATVQSGRAAIEAFWKAAIGTAVKTLTLTTREVYGSGDVATEVGAFKSTDASGKANSGKYVVVWKKVGGTWLVWRDIWNADAPPPAK